MENISEQVMSVINQIAEKLGIAVEKLYPILRKQATIDGYINIICLVGSIVGLLLSLIYFYKNPDNSVDDYNETKRIDLFKRGIFIVIMTLSAIGFIAQVIFIKDTIVALFNPDWYIINNILKNLVK